MKGIEISSNTKGIGAALTNPTTISLIKGNIKHNYPVVVDGKRFQDAEAAFQSLKPQERLKTQEYDRITLLLMQRILTEKLRQHPKLVREITRQGGSKWLMQCSHRVQDHSWGGYGLNSKFIFCLNRAYCGMSDKFPKDGGIESSIRDEEAAMRLFNHGMSNYSHGRHKVFVKNELVELVKMLVEKHATKVGAEVDIKVTPVSRGKSAGKSSYMGWKFVSPTLMGDGVPYYPPKNISYRTSNGQLIRGSEWNGVRSFYS